MSVTMAQPGFLQERETDGPAQVGERGVCDHQGGEGRG